MDSAMNFIRKLPHTLNKVIITLIPKTGKDLEEVGSYRPILPIFVKHRSKNFNKDFSQKSELLDRKAGTP